MDFRGTERIDRSWIASSYAPSRAPVTRDGKREVRPILETPPARLVMQDTTLMLGESRVWLVRCANPLLHLQSLITRLAGNMAAHRMTMCINADSRFLTIDGQGVFSASGDQQCRAPTLFLPFESCHDAAACKGVSLPATVTRHCLSSGSACPNPYRPASRGWRCATYICCRRRPSLLLQSPSLHQRRCPFPHQHPLQSLRRPPTRLRLPVLQIKHPRAMQVCAEPWELSVWRDYSPGAVLKPFSRHADRW